LLLRAAALTLRCWAVRGGDGALVVSLYKDDAAAPLLPLYS
jgi:hypothetical protein